MRVITSRICSGGSGCDTIQIRDYDHREVYFKRAHLPQLIKLLRSEAKRPSVIQATIGRPVSPDGGGWGP